MPIARNQSFDRIAAEYDAVRPGYPEALYDRIIDYAPLSLFLARRSARTL